MTLSEYLKLKEAIIERGYAHEIDWAETVKEPPNAYHFFREVAWVIVNSGMKNQVAEGIWMKIMLALEGERRVCTAFKHPGKAKAIQDLWDRRRIIFGKYKKADDKLAFLEALPWIGPITKYHAAKNLGMDCCKPDRHLVRIAKACGLEVTEMCLRLAKATGDRIGTVDLVIWRAANLGLV